MPFGVELRIVDDDGVELAARRRQLGPAAGARAVGGEALFRPRRTRSTPMAGSTPATSRCSTPTARCRSPTAPRTSSSRAASGSARSSWRTPRSAAPALPRRRRSASTIRNGTSGRCCWSCASPAATVTAADITAHLAQHVAKWWLPDEVVFVDELPHTATGKLLKTELRERYKDYRLVSAPDSCPRADARRCAR